MIPEANPAQSADNIPPRVESGLSFVVKKFGRVVDADINLAPLTIFVGKNNTGKSYLASLVWCISNIGRLLQRKECIEIRPKWINEFFRGVDSADFGAKEILIDKSRREEILSWINQCLKSAGRAFFTEMFAFDGFAGVETAISRACLAHDLYIHLRTELVPKQRRHQLFYNISIDGVNDGIEHTLPTGIQTFDVTSYIVSQLVAFDLFGFDRFYMTATYIPAARTGLMLAFPNIVSQLILRSAPNSPEAARLQMPQTIIDFLSTLTYGFALPVTSSDQIAEWLEQRLLGGRLTVSDDAVPNITYRPNDADLDIPLHAVSSMITEVAPILLGIRRSFGAKQLILEEPEAHLHLSAQRLIAQGIVRLVNCGINVLITTHSDTLIQQINNLLKLHKVGIQDGDDYEDQDILNPEFVAGYEFIAGDGGTYVKRLEMRDEGLVVRSINETLLDLADETINLNEAVKDD